MMKTDRLQVISGNILKIIALITMTCDHVGMQLFPQYLILRYIGRLSFPIFAYMIAEGAKYTQNRARYLLQMFSLGAICSVVYYFAMGSLYQCILITFTLSVVLIYAIDHALKKNDAKAWIFLMIAAFTVIFLVEILPNLLPETDYNVDYGIWGVLTPVFVYVAPEKIRKLMLMIIPLGFLAFVGASYQWIAFFALIPLALYSGKRGKYKMKNLFYIYYPVHLVVIYAISRII